MDYSSICAELCLIAGGVIAGVKKAWIYVAAFAAGAFLILAEAIQEIKTQ